MTKLWIDYNSIHATNHGTILAPTFYEGFASNLYVDHKFFSKYFIEVDPAEATQNEIILFDLEFGEDTYSGIMNTYNNILKEIEDDKQRHAEGWKGIV